jgi:Ca2+-binding RTX toxin-like protein
MRTPLAIRSLPATGRRRSAAIVGALALVATLLPTSANAIVSCTYSVATATASVTMGADDSTTISRSGTAILVDGQQCGSATVNNTDAVNVLGSDAGVEAVVISLAGGAFEPGATSESGVSEIEFSVALGNGTDRLEVLGGGGAETFLASGSGLNLNGDADVDVISSSTEILILDGGGGNDTIDASAMATQIDVRGGAGTDTVSGGSAADAVSGGSENDVVRPGGGNDVVDGGSGGDTLDLSGAPGGVTVDLAAGQSSGQGTDVVSNVENVQGSGFADTIVGNGVANALSGGNGDDVLEGRLGDDAIDGGPGSDVASYANATGQVTIDMGAGTASGADGNDTLVSIESVIGSPFGGGITGDAGDNTFVATNGSDVLNGQGGNDTVDYSDAPAGVTVNLGLTTAQNTGGSGTDTLSNIENVIGSAHADTLLGSAGANRLDGGIGIDTVSYANASGDVTIDLRNDSASGAGGNDVLISLENAVGSPFDDAISGDAAANVMDGAAGTDTIDYSDALTAAPASAQPGVGVTVNLSLTIQQATGDGNDTILRFENVIGSKHNDRITGNADDNIVEGGLGNDSVNGGEGKDVVSYVNAPQGIQANLAQKEVTGGDGSDDLESVEGVIGSSFNDAMKGSDGDDFMDGGAGSDTISYEDSKDGVAVDLKSGDAVGQGTDKVAGFENVVGSSGDDSLLGNGAVNSIKGGAGKDVMSGRAGNDRLVGGVGDDAMKGNSGNDGLVGGAGNDQLSGGSGADMLNGRAGSDICIGGSGRDSFSSCETTRD